MPYSYLEAAANNLIYQAVEKLPEETWKKSEKEIIAAFDGLMSADQLSQSLNDSLGKLSFRSLQIRSLSAEVKKNYRWLRNRHEMESRIRPGKIASDADSAFLEYHFKSASDEPIVLRTDFEMPVTMAQLHKIMVSMVGDDSWHQINATLDVEGSQWKSGLTTYIAQYRPNGIMFQPPGFDDTTYQPHIWIPLNKTETAAPADNSKSFATLRLIKPSGTLGAIYGKVQRNYLRAFRAVPFWMYLINSVLLVALQVVGALFSSAFVAYAFARLKWPGRSLAFGLLLSTMMLPEQVTMIPRFVVWRSIGWYNTLNPLWIGSWCGIAFFIFLMTQNMKTIPKEMEEAARIDGLNALQTWWYIILPLVKTHTRRHRHHGLPGSVEQFHGPARLPPRPSQISPQPGPSSA